MAWLQSLNMGEILVYGLAFGLPLVAIVSGSIVTVVKLVIKHRERMAMIEQGLIPDDFPAGCAAGKSKTNDPGGLAATQPYVGRGGKP